MTDASDHGRRSLIQQVEDELRNRPDVERTEVRPAETTGVVATVWTESGTEHYHVTLETHPSDGSELHWATLGEEPDV